MKRVALALLISFLSFGLHAEEFQKTHALIFIYESHCPYCQQMAPVVSTFSKMAHFLVSPVSVDGQPIAPFDYFDIPKPALLQAVFANQAVEYPALVLLNLKTKALYPVSIGALTIDELGFRMNELIPKVMQYENRGQQ